MTILYHTALLDNWMQPAKELRAALKEASGASVLHLVGRSKNQKIELDADFVLEKVNVDGRSFTQKQVSFHDLSTLLLFNTRSWSSIEKALKSLLVCPKSLISGRLVELKITISAALRA